MSREEINDAVRQYLQKGGEITVCTPTFREFPATSVNHSFVPGTKLWLMDSSEQEFGDHSDYADNEY